MTTGKKAWLSLFPTMMGRVERLATVSLEEPTPTANDSVEHTEGVFLTQAELDTLVAAAEARGAAGVITYIEMSGEEIIAHTQRQRDEGYNEGVEAVAREAGSLFDMYGNHVPVAAILALRKPTTEETK